MTANDFYPIIQAVIAGIAAVITAMIGVFVPRAISAFEARTGIVVTAQQQATVLGAAKTAAGILQTKIDQGILKIGHISIDEPVVQMEAQAALARVPEAAAALGKSEQSMTETIVGLIDTSPKPPVVAVAVPPEIIAPTGTVDLPMPTIPIFKI